jgi:hypothetical protein
LKISPFHKMQWIFQISSLILWWILHLRLILKFKDKILGFLMLQSDNSNLKTFKIRWTFNTLIFKIIKALTKCNLPNLHRYLSLDILLLYLLITKMIKLKCKDLAIMDNINLLEFKIYQTLNSIMWIRDYNTMSK